MLDYSSGKFVILIIVTVYKVDTVTNLYTVGKSSLLYHFYLTWEQRVAAPNSYTVIYLSLQSVQCQCENDFYQTIASYLLSRPSIRSKKSICDVLTQKIIDRMTFTLVMAECKKQNILPVICLDDFKELFDHKNEFDDGFYDNLRPS